AKVQCPECNAISPIPDNVLGRKVRCKNCKAEFVATAREGIKTSRDKPLEIPPEDPGAVITVVARRIGGKAANTAAGSPLWLAVALLALLLPIAGAGAFAALKWNRPGAGTEDATATDNTSGGSSREPGEYYGAIEVGSKGVKYAYFEIYPDKEHSY